MIICYLACIDAPRVTSLYHTSSTTNLTLTLTCTSTNSPATTVTWMKDGDTLDIDGVKYKTYQTVTDRRSSTYENTLVVDDVIENIPGNYTCRVTNRLGSSSRVLTVSEGKYSRTARKSGENKRRVRNLSVAEQNNRERKDAVQGVQGWKTCYRCNEIKNSFKNV